MRDADRTIERLLAGLRDAQPPGGMERRILEALGGAGAREVASVPLWRRRLRPAIAMLLACTVILIVAFTVQQRKHVPGQQFVPLKPTEGLNGAPNISSSLRVGQKPQKIRSHRGAISRISPAGGETRTASFPAPPLPLTEQEQLLLRLAHRGDADNLAILNPDARAAQTAKAAEQFQQFFAINAKEMRSQSE
jgi:hypothetical protein